MVGSFFIRTPKVRYLPNFPESPTLATSAPRTKDAAGVPGALALDRAFRVVIGV